MPSTRAPHAPRAVQPSRSDHRGGAAAANPRAIPREILEDERIDSGAELFGNHTPSADRGPPRPDSNGYAALAQYDFQEFGGNEDGRISRADAVWGDLRVWIDANHDGVSQPDELVPLERLGVVEIGLDYSIRSEKDRYGNLFRFESYAVTRDPSGTERRIPTWDVFRVSGADR